MPKVFWCLLIGIFLSGFISAQADPVLFTIDGKEVPLSEFEYIYKKNNRNDADFSRASLSEYLDLYIKFKLKVHRARELQLDTIKALQEELGGYRKQLARSYLNDKEVKERLVREAYDRMQWDVHIGHILVKTGKQAKDNQKAEAEERIQQIYSRIRQGEDFKKLAQEVSDDANTNEEGGDLGWVTAMFPNGFYSMENVAYSLDPGEVSKPFKTDLGYHILKLYEKRPARGTMEAAHILVRVDKNNMNKDQARQKIESIYRTLEEGVPFENLAKNMSEDKETADRGGYIGSFGINTYEKNFEDAAFALEEDGDYTEPIRTRLGWHIVKRLKKPQARDFESLKNRLEAQVSRNERIDIARETMIDRIREESGFKLDSAALLALDTTLDKSFLQYQWIAPKVEETALISFADGTTISNKEFIHWLRTHTRERLRMPKGTTPHEALMNMLEQYANEEIMAYEERNLEEKYPDFKALMREYEEGILLFEVTKMAVWDKAGQDTAGLRKFYEAHRNDYMWPERIQVKDYTIAASGADKLDKIMKWRQKLSEGKLLSKANKHEEILKVRTRTLEKKAAGDLKWEAGYMTEVQKDEETGNLTFTAVESIIPPEPKSLNEARGYIIADYQDQLEQEWIAELKDKYTVEINHDVLDSLIKS